MKELKEHNANLVSIKPYEPNEWSETVFFRNLFVRFSKDAKCLILMGQRPINIKGKPVGSFFNRMDETLVDVEYLYKSEIFEFVALIPLANNRDLVVRLLIELWQYFEQPAFQMGNSYIKDLIPREWSRIIRTFNEEKYVEYFDTQYLFFKGIEEDVLWIRKNKLQLFPVMVDILDYQPDLGRGPIN